MDVSRNAPRALVAAAVLVAFVLLPSVMVVGVMASSAVPSQSAPGYPQVDVEFEALIVVSKFVDADGSLETEVDQTFVEMEFVLETDATITDTGDNRWAVSYGSRGASITLTEGSHEGFELLAAFCVEPTSGYGVGALKGDSLTVELQVAVQSTTYDCQFINRRSAVESVGDGTGTPPSNTLPPTDSGGHTSAPTSDGWRVMLVVLAGVLAAALVSIPIGRTDGTVSRRR
jgi:hypothetical protein